MDFSPLSTEATYRDVLETEFNYVTPGNETKWGSIQPTSPQQWSFSNADTIINTARSDHQAIKGHTLVWHSQLPPFINDSLSANQLEKYLDKFISKVVKRYKHKIRAWDVVNEAIADDGTMRDTVFLRKFGPSYIAHAFREAHKADHDAKLYYNDYNIDTINTKSNAVFALVQSLKQAHVPIHGVGFQMHLVAESAPSTEAMVANLQRFADLGLSVNISELDVRVATLSGTPATKLAIQKQVYHRVVAACMQVQRCVSVTTWGFTDKYSWIDFTFGPDDPLEYDELYRRKPAYFGIVDGFVNVPADAVGTQPNLLPNASFEVGTDGWTIWGGAIARTAKQKHTGLRSVEISARTATFQGPVHDVRALVTPGRGYTVSAWARIDAASDTVKLSAKSRCSGGTDAFTTLDTKTATNTGWVELAGELAVANCTLDELVIYVEGPAAGVNLYVDDAALRPIPGELGPNLIANPGFETNAAGWFGFGGPTVTASAAQAHSGAQSGHATNRTANWQGPAYNLLGLAIPTNVYQATGWVRLDGVAADQAKMTLKVTCSAVDQFITVASGTALGSGWTLLTGSFTMPSCAPSEVTFYFEGPAAGVNMFIDDISVRQDVSSLGPNVVANGTFESGSAGWFGFGPPTISATALQAHSGLQSGYATNRTDTWQGIATNLLSVTTAGEYEAVAWVRVEGVAAAQVRLTLKSRCNAVDQFTTIGSGDATNTGWVQITGTLVRSSCALTELTMYFEGPAAGVNIFIDDVSVRRKPTPPVTNLVGNPGFETSTSGWVAWGGAVISQTTAQAHSGAASGVVTNRTGTWQGPVANMLPVTQSGASYSVSFWARLGVASDQLFITVKSVCTDTTTAFTQLHAGTATNSAWSQHTGTLVVPACPLTELSLYLEGPAIGVDIFLDDVEVFAIP